MSTLTDDVLGDNLEAWLAHYGEDFERQCLQLGIRPSTTDVALLSIVDRLCEGEDEIPSVLLIATREAVMENITAMRDIIREDATADPVWREAWPIGAWWVYDAQENKDHGPYDTREDAEFGGRDKNLLPRVCFDCGDESLAVRSIDGSDLCPACLDESDP